MEQRGFNPVSGVEIIDSKTKEIIQRFLFTDPEFQLHLKSDEKGGQAHQKDDTHIPEKRALPIHGPDSTNFLRHYLISH